jgi:hypothetical protein
MFTKAVVAGVVLLAVIAAADAVQQTGEDRATAAAGRPEARLTSWRIDRGPTPCRSLVLGACGRYFVQDGGVTRDGRGYLDRRALAAAFPDASEVQVDAYRVARARDGTLAVAVIDAYGRGAVEVWSGRSLAGSFRVPARSFAAGLGWSPAGDLVATYPRRGAPVLYDRRGHRVAQVRWERRPG